MNTSELFLSAVEAKLLEKGWSKKRLADEMGIHAPALSRWWKEGAPLPTTTTIARAAKAFDCTVADLLSSSPRNDVTSSNDTKRSSSDTGTHPVAVRAVPIISWAHAGQAAAYEELPKSWQDQTYTTCRDPKAFALSVEGDSMSPHCLPGDLVVLMPSEEARNGCMVVAKLTDDGIILRRYTRLSTGIRLSAYNPMYPPADYPHESFLWIYPVHSTVRREWS